MDKVADTCRVPALADNRDKVDMVGIAVGFWPKRQMELLQLHLLEMVVVILQILDYYDDNSLLSPPNIEYDYKIIICKHIAGFN